jgi:transmembrane sensor
MSEYTKEAPSAQARAEAAAWIARLHGSNRTREAELGLRQWLADSPENAAAFEFLTDTWERSLRLRPTPVEVMGKVDRIGLRLSWSRALLATAAIAIVAVLGTALYLHTEGVTTGIGEQRTIALEDGSRVFLNTNSHIVVHYNKQLRRIELDQGEALFEVAKHPDRPFVVTAGSREVRALGTSFVVRREVNQLSVTLVEGMVSVSPPPQDSGSPKPEAPAVVTLSPGQRLTLDGAGARKIDRPAVDRLTAWQRGQIVFDDTPLEQAVAEMNRYSALPIHVESGAAQAVRVSGIFRAGDSENLARALARTHGLEVTQGANEILIGR